MDIKEIIDILACPVCHGELEILDRLGETVGLACDRCQLVYPVEKDIAILLEDKSIPRAEWDRRGGE